MGLPASRTQWSVPSPPRGRGGFYLLSFILLFWFSWISSLSEGGLAWTPLERDQVLLQLFYSGDASLPGEVAWAASPCSGRFGDSKMMASGPAAWAWWLATSAVIILVMEAPSPCDRDDCLGFF